MNLDEERHERTARRLAASLDEPERHLDFDGELSPYVDGTLDAAGREIVESHVEDCAMCRRELIDLQQLAGSAPRPKTSVWVLGTAAAAAMAFFTFLMLRPAATPPGANHPGPAVAVPMHPPVPPVSPRPAYTNPDWARLVEQVLASGHLPVSPEAKALRGSTDDVLRGGGGGSTRAALSPSGVVVETTRPRFTWPASSGASYVVSVFAGEDEVVTTPPLTDAHWQPDDGLRRGITYTWQVEVTEDGSSTILPAPPAPPARFRILGGQEHEELDAARHEYPSDALLLAALYSRHGLVAEAEAELEKLRTSGDPRVQRLVSGHHDAEPTRTKAAQ